MTDSVELARQCALAIGIAKDAIALVDRLEFEALEVRATSRKQLERRKLSPELAALKAQLEALTAPSDRP